MGSWKGDSNPGGPGGYTRKIKASGGGGGHRRKGCCSYAEAGKAVTRLQFRLAARYIRMDIKARMGVI